MQNRNTQQNRKFVKKVTVTNWIIAIVVSILIGLITSLLMGGSLNRSWNSYLWNAGYSISLGVPLFANSYLFKWFEKRFINWISNPVKSIFAALSLHLVYSSFVIFTVNWFWFIVILDRKWETFWSSNKATIISEYIIFVIIASIIYAISFFKALREQVKETELVKSEALALKYKVWKD